MFARSAEFFDAPTSHRARFGARPPGDPEPSSSSPPAPPLPEDTTIVNGFHETG